MDYTENSMLLTCVLFVMCLRISEDFEMPVASFEIHSSSKYCLLKFLIAE